MSFRFALSPDNYHSSITYLIHSFTVIHILFPVYIQYNTGFVIDVEAENTRYKPEVQDMQGIRPDLTMYNNNSHIHRAHLFLSGHSLNPPFSRLSIQFLFCN